MIVTLGVQLWDAFVPKRSVQDLLKALQRWVEPTRLMSFFVLQAGHTQFDALQRLHTTAFLHVRTVQVDPLAGCLAEVGRPLSMVW